MSKRKLIIDCDPGIDDAFAIVAAMSHPDFEIIGITTVAGNVTVKHGARNAAELITLLNYPTQVYLGSYNSMNKMEHHDHQHKEVAFHGPTGFGEEVLDYDEKVIADKDAIDFILEMMKKYPHEVEILALGPLSNLGRAIEKDPETMKLCKAIYSMGGGIYRSNATKYAEFNYYGDGRSVKLVIEFAKYVPFTMIGLDATHSVIFDYNCLAELDLSNTAVGKLLCKMGTFYAHNYYRANGYMGCVLHDAYSFLTMFNQEIIEQQQDFLIHVYESGEREGQTAVEEDGTLVHTIMKFNKEKTTRCLIDTILKRC